MTHDQTPTGFRFFKKYRQDMVTQFCEVMPELCWRAGGKICASIFEEMSAYLQDKPIEPTLWSQVLMTLFIKSVQRYQALEQSWSTLKVNLKSVTDKEAADIRMTWAKAWPKYSTYVHRKLRGEAPSYEACAERYIYQRHRLEQRIEYLLRNLKAADDYPQLSGADASAKQRLKTGLWWIIDNGLRWPVRVQALETFQHGWENGLIPDLMHMSRLRSLIRLDEEHARTRVAALRALRAMACDVGDIEIRHVMTETEGAALSLRQQFVIWDSPIELVWDKLHHSEFEVVRQSAAIRFIETSSLLNDIDDQNIGDPSKWLERIGADDASVVRGAFGRVIESGIERLDDIGLKRLLLSASYFIEYETDPIFVRDGARTLLELFFDPAFTGRLEIGDGCDEALGRLITSIQKRLDDPQIELAVDSWLWVLLDCLELIQNESSREDFLALKALLGVCEIGRKIKVPVVGDERLLRKMCRVIGSMDHGLYVKRGKKTWRIQRGSPRRRWLWRFLREIRYPAYDKRTGHSHLTGMTYYGDLWFPPYMMGEVTRTRVPGEYVYHDKLGHWVPHIPSPTDLVNMGLKKNVTIEMPNLSLTFTAGNYVKRLQSHVKTSWRFEHIDNERQAAVRNGADEVVKGYLKRLKQENGRSIELNHVSPLFKGWHLSSIIPLEVSHLFYQIRDELRQSNYWMNPYTASTKDLLAFASFILSFILIRAFVMYRKIRFWRASIPLSMGGWGSRGKSGTERLKAAFFYGHGYQVFSKTTGTLPTFISSIPGLDPGEVPLFRVYDKASIWEQIDVLRQASRMDAQVFLWEAMALNPRYVQILQHDWMRDDIASITNTYPDHEDVQGPTGYDVALTISNFMPRKSRVVSSEQQMVPMLVDRARQFKSHYQHATPFFSRLITEDELNRLPYLEHPLNLALMIQGARMLDIGRDDAMMTMADHLVADIGALKVYPAFRVNHSFLEFTNVMAANERAGCLASVERLGFLDIHEDRCFWHRNALIVNNRADRPARSRVFARVLAFDVPADNVFIVGSAVNEFGVLLNEALDEMLSQAPKPESQDVEAWTKWVDGILYTLRRKQSALGEIFNRYEGYLGLTRTDIESVLKPIAEQATQELSSGELKRTRLSTVDDALQKSFTQLFERPEAKAWPAEDKTKTIEQATEDFKTALYCVALKERTARGGLSDSEASALVEFFKNTVMSRLHLVTDPGVKAETVAKTMADKMPAGSQIHSVGMQNIKGPGLKIVEFAIRMSQLLERIDQTSSKLAQTRKSAWEWLLARQYQGEIEKKVVKDFCTRHDDPAVEMELKSLVQKVTEAQSGQKEEVSKLAVWARKHRKKAVKIDSIFDFRDSMHRRRIADDTMDRLASGVMSHAKASEILNQVYARQKSGRLQQWIDGL